MDSLATSIENAKRQLGVWERELHALEIKVSELGAQTRTRLHTELQVLRADWDAFTAKILAWELRLESALEDDWGDAKMEWQQAIQGLKHDYQHLVSSIQRIKTEIANQAA